jgi:4-amino-4-deoxy-L-arabinose transferase-like glycosyltransferase
MNEERRILYAAPAMLAGVILLSYLFLSTRSTIWDRDEALYAVETQEMLQTGNYLYPTVNHSLRSDKPILMFWLMAPVMNFLGPTNELAARLVAVLATTAVCLLTFALGRKLFSAHAGLWAMAIAATTPAMLAAGTAATSDMLLTACLCGTLAIFLHSLQRGFNLGHLLLMIPVFGAALLAKGPIAPAILLPTVAATWWFALHPGTRASCPPFGWPAERRPSAGKMPAIPDEAQRGRRGIFFILLATLGAIVIFLAWAIPASLATHWDFLKQFFGHHVYERAVKPLEGHGGNPLLYLPYYLPVIILLFFPWTLFLPGAFAALLGGRLVSRSGKWFLLGWLGPFFILMSLAFTKLQLYILPLWPALALLAAGTLDAHRRGMLTPRDYSWLRRGAWLAGPLAFLGALLLAASPWFVPALAANSQKPALQVFLLILSQTKWACTATGITAAIISGAALWKFVFLRLKAAAAACLAGNVLLMVFIAFCFIPAIETLKVAKPLARLVLENSAPDESLAEFGYREASLNYYLNRGPIRRLNQKECQEWAKEHRPGVLIVERSALPTYKTLALREIGSVKGFNYSKNEWCDLVVLKRWK